MDSLCSRWPVALLWSRPNESWSILFFRFQMKLSDICFGVETPLLRIEIYILEILLPCTCP